MHATRDESTCMVTKREPKAPVEGLCVCVCVCMYVCVCMCVCVCVCVCVCFLESELVLGAL